MIHASANVNNKNLTTGGSGFGVMVILTGIERGWITRKEGAKRILTLVRYLDKAERIKGVWSHWMNAEGQPVKFGKQIESGDLVETSFMMMGLYAAQAYLTENNPSGKLTLTFLLTTGQVPLYYNMKNTGRPLGLKSVSSEKYKSRYIDCPNEPLYPFGYGLSYATFEYSNIQPSSVIAEEGDKLQFSATVTNTGNVDGEEVVQLYIRDMKGSVTRPVRELKGFQKILIKAGESRKVTFNLAPEALSFTRKDMTWGQEKGEYKLWIGGNSNATLEASFTIK